MGGFPLLGLFVAACAGALVGAWVPAQATAVALWGAAATIVFLFALGILAWWHRRGTALVALMIVTMLAFFSSALGTVRAQQASQERLQSLCRNTFQAGPRRMVAIVDGTTSRVFDSDSQTQKQRFRGLRTQVMVLGAACAPATQELVPLGQRFSLFVLQDVALRRGDRLLLRAEIEYAQAPRNPVGPDPRFLAQRQNLSGMLRLDAPVVRTDFGHGAWAMLDTARNRLSRQIELAFGGHAAGFLKAVLLADRGAIAPERREAWAAAGVAHLLAISGLHMGIVGAIAYGLWIMGLALIAGERLFVRRYAALAAALTVIVFCLFTGAPVSAQRAAIMAAAAFLGHALGRRATALNSLSLAGIGIVLWDTSALLDPGFLLSFSAVLALLAIPLLKQKKVHAPQKDGGLRRPVRALGIALLTSTIAALATMPVTLYFFGQVSLIAPLVNLFAVPVATLIILPMAMVWLLLAATSLGPMVAALITGVFDALDHVIVTVGSWPLATMHPPMPNAWEITMAFAVLLSLVLAAHRLGPRPWSRRPLTWFGGALVLMLIMLLLTLAPRIWQSFGDGQLHVEHLYVGQGDAALITFPGGTKLLYDGGGAIPPSDWDPGKGIVAPYLRREGIYHLDYLVISHPHPDHIKGLVYIAEHFSVGELWWNGDGPHLEDMQRIIAGVQKNGGGVSKLFGVDDIREIDGVQVHLSQPGASLHAADPAKDPRFDGHTYNDRSLALTLRYGQRSYLLAGDVEIDAEARLAQTLAPVDIFKASHHGSRTSSSDAFLQAAKAKLAIISCGHRNTFKFPHPEPMARLRGFGIEPLRTDRDGLLHLHTDGGSHWQIHRWRHPEEVLTIP